ncbi:MAG: hypothetical protein NUV97_01475 [archaeon]|nr:hypothetical protein [archaeon]MCR4323624.1 hypothetical protein [Nanoarchaeota archaeon]
MNTTLIFVWIWAAMIAMSFWEAYVEGRNAWDKKKYGWKFKIGKFVFTGYHFFVFWVMFPLLLTLPFVMFGWNAHLFWMVVAAFISGMIIEDFFWYIVNPEVKLREFWSSFSDYYPWIKINGKKIIPIGYVLGVILTILIVIYF